MSAVVVNCSQFTAMAMPTADVALLNSRTIKVEYHERIGRRYQARGLKIPEEG
jgi:hypothetical protein